MVAAHRRDLKDTKGKKDSGSLKDKEREIREKLVLKMRRKAEVSVTSQEGRVTKVKGGGSELEAVSDEDLSDEELEDVSEEEGEGGRSSDEELSEIDSSEELRLTSTDEEAEKGGKEAREKRRRKQEKERARARKQRELTREINRAERIAAREEAAREGRKEELEARDRSHSARRGSRARSPTKYGSAVDYMDRRRRSQDREESLGEFERGERDRRRFMDAARLKKVDRFLTQSGMRKEQVEKEMERAYEKYFSTLSRKEGSVYRAGSSRAPSHRPRTEQDEKEEQWERMTNPHLFGSEHGGGFRKVKAGQHYEEVQKEVLQTEIRIRERREQSRAASERPRVERSRSRYSPVREYSRYSRASSSRYPSPPPRW